MWRLRRRLFAVPISLLKYSFRAGVAAIVGSVILAFLSFLVFKIFGSDPQHHTRKDLSSGLQMFFSMVVIAPMTETLLLWVLLRVLTLFVPNGVLVLCISSLLWGLAHGVQGAMSLLPSVWGFFVFSLGVWRYQKVAFWCSYVAGVVPHMMLNLFAFTLISIGSFIQK
jgi:hypothetical protein